MNQVKLTYFCLFLTSVNLSAQSFSEKEDGIFINDKSFPWETVINKGKILGCVYESRFYSLGSILILESLPRKCELASDRNGYWEQLSEVEMELFTKNIEAQRTLEREATFIGNEPLNVNEARLIRYLRSTKSIADKNKN